MARLLNKAFQISLPNQLFLQQKRFKAKINLKKPRPTHYVKALHQTFLTPFFPNHKEGKTLIDLCTKANKISKKIDNPYHEILARDALNWFDNSKMIAFLHKNSIKQEDVFDLAVLLKRKNMYLKCYPFAVLKLALKGTTYEAVEMLFHAPFYIIFSPEKNVTDLEKILKKTPQVILMAGILEGKLLNLNDFKLYGKMDLISAQVSLVQVLQNAGGNNLNQQLIHYPSKLVSQLRQIGTSDAPSQEN